MPDPTTLHLVAYDLACETRQELAKRKRAWVHAKRTQIWYELRYRFDCVPLQHSLWLVRKPAQLEGLRARISAWEKEYGRSGVGSPLIEVFRVAVDRAGLKVFRGWEFNALLEWLGSLDMSLTRALARRRLTPQAYSSLVRKFELIDHVLHEDFDASSGRFAEAEDELLLLNDKLHQATRHVQKGGRGDG